MNWGRTQFSHNREVSGTCGDSNRDRQILKRDLGQEELAED